MALYYHGRLTEKKGNLKEALQDFEDVLQRYPQSVIVVLARKDADRLTAKLGLNVQAQPSPSVASASASPQASPASPVCQPPRTPPDRRPPTAKASPKSTLEP